MAGRRAPVPRSRHNYSIDGNKASRVRKICSRCGHGTFMSTTRTGTTVASAT